MVAKCVTLQDSQATQVSQNITSISNYNILCYMPRFVIFRDELHEFHEIQYLALKSVTSLDAFSRPCRGVTFCDNLCKARVKIIDQLL